MIKLFDIQDGQLKATEHCFAIKWLYDIMVLYPDCYLKIYRYIFYMTCPDQELNPYFNLTDEDKSVEIMRMLEVDTVKEFMADDDRIQLAIRESLKMYTTPTQMVFRAAKGMLEKLTVAFQTEELVWGGKEATGPALVASMEKLPKLISVYQEAELKLNQELKNRARGNQTISDDIDELDE